MLSIEPHDNFFLISNIILLKTCRNFLKLTVIENIFLHYIYFKK